MTSLALFKQHAWKLIALLLFLWLQYQLWFDETGVMANLRMDDRIEQQLEVNEALQARNQVLTEEILSIKSGPTAIEAKARKELGMIKDGETYFIVVKPKLHSGAEQ